MQKGITPVVAIVLLLMIIISIVAAAFVFFSRVTETSAQAGEEQLQQALQSGGLPHIVAVDKNKVHVRNAGGTVLTNPTFYVAGKKIDATGPSSLAQSNIGTYELNKVQLAELPKVAEVKVTTGGFSDSIVATLREIAARIISMGTLLTTGMVVAAQEDGILFKDSSGNDMAIITDTGRVGIGTTGPAGRFHVHTGSGVGQFVLSDVATADITSRWRIGAVDEFETRYSDAGNYFRFWDISAGAATADSILFGTDESYRMGIWPSGGISIGSTYATNNDAGANNMIIQGNVGIGTASPQFKLEVVGGSMHAYNSATLSSELTSSDWRNHPTAHAYETFSPSGSSITSAINTAGFGSATDRAWGDGITYVTPGARFIVTGTLTLNSGQAPTVVLSNSPFNVDYSTSAVLTPGAFSVTLVGTAEFATATLVIQNNAPTDFSITGISMKRVDGGNVIARGLFTGGGASGIKVAQNGNIGIGTTSPGSRLEVENTASADDVLLLEDSSGLCEAQPTTTGLTWSCSSDIALKENISVSTFSALDYLKNIPLFDYTVKKTGERAMGVIAQKLNSTHPELVSVGDDGLLVASTPTAWQLVKAIQEQQNHINQLTKENQELKARIANLEVS